MSFYHPTQIDSTSSHNLVEQLLTYRATEVVWRIIPYVTWEFLLYRHRGDTYTWLTGDSTPADATQLAWPLDSRGLLVDLWHFVTQQPFGPYPSPRGEDGNKIILGEPSTAPIVYTIADHLDSLAFPIAAMTWLSVWNAWAYQCASVSVQQDMLEMGWPYNPDQTLPNQLAAWVRGVLIREGW